LFSFLGFGGFLKDFGDGPSGVDSLALVNLNVRAAGQKVRSQFRAFVVHDKNTGLLAFKLVLGYPLFRIPPFLVDFFYTPSLPLCFYIIVMF
jgi:hypothetical protein